VPQRRQLPLYAVHALPDVGGRILASLIFETPVYLPETFDPPLDLRTYYRSERYERPYPCLRWPNGRR
jgi:hypothetical protein